MKEIIIAMSVFVIFALGSCQKETLTPTSTKDNTQPPNLFIPPESGIVGIWPMNPPFTEEIEAWNFCVGATGIIMPGGLDYPTILADNAQLADNLGYWPILWRGFVDSLELIPEMMQNNEIGPYVDGFYADEPFLKGWSNSKFLQLVNICSTYGKRLAFSDPILANLENGRSLVAQNYPSMVNQVIYMPDRYFDYSWNHQTAFYDSVKTWAQNNSILLANIMPFVSPSCTFPTWQAAQGCSTSWTYDIICRHKQSGFGGIFIFPGNNINSSHLAQMNASLDECNWSEVIYNCEYDLTYSLF